MRNLSTILTDLAAILWSISMLAVAVIAVPAATMALGYIAIPWLRLDPMPPDVGWPWLAGGVALLVIAYWCLVGVAGLALWLIPDFNARHAAKPYDEREHMRQHREELRERMGKASNKPPGQQIPPHRSGGGMDSLAGSPKPDPYEAPLPKPGEPTT